MKTNTCAAILSLALMSAGSVFAQANATTDPVGFITLNLQLGNNFVGFSLQPPPAFQGAVTVDPMDASHIFLTNTTVTDDQFNTVPHVIELTSGGANQGGNTVITDTIATGSELVLQSIIPGLVDGSTVRITRNWTLAEVFGAANEAGLTPGTSSTADLILIPTTSGGYDQYYYSSGGFVGVGWRKVGSVPGSANQAGAAFYYTDGFLILARSAKSVTLMGSVKKGQTTVVLETGNNFVANLDPVASRTLGNSNLYTGGSDGVSSGTSSTADLVLFWNGSGYDQYYYSSGGFVGVGWRKIGSVPGSTDQTAVALPNGAFIILRRGAPTTVTLSQISI